MFIHSYSPLCDSLGFTWIDGYDITDHKKNCRLLITGWKGLQSEAKDPTQHPDLPEGLPPNSPQLCSTNHLQGSSLVKKYLMILYFKNASFLLSCSSVFWKYFSWNIQAEKIRGFRSYEKQVWHLIWVNLTLTTDLMSSHFILMWGLRERRKCFHLLINWNWKWICVWLCYYNLQSCPSSSSLGS